MIQRNYEQRVGRFRLTSSTYGHPVSSEVEHVELNGTRKVLKLHGVEELHDLRYAVERILSQLEQDAA